MLTSKLSLVDSIASVVELWADVRSKDPNTKVAACIYDKQSGGLFLGYNGFPSCIPDEEEIWNCRDGDNLLGLSKYDLVVHAEVNAVTKALKSGVDISKCILVSSVIPCEKCMKDVILPHRIKEVYYIKDTFHSFNDHAKHIVNTLAKLAGVSMIQVRKN